MRILSAELALELKALHAVTLMVSMRHKVASSMSMSCRSVGAEPASGLNGIRAQYRRLQCLPIPKDLHMHMHVFL